LGLIAAGLSGFFAKPKCPVCKAVLQNKPPICPHCRTPLKWGS
jgi:predicted amidophosphoribosyltransferase